MSFGIRNVINAIISNRKGIVKLTVPFVDLQQFYFQISKILLSLLVLLHSDKV
ncbi:MAG: hypothetical protein K0S80_3642 [Neobacillus sp.]|nr:hypothetical protein [Neobacillus sp.]